MTERELRDKTMKAIPVTKRHIELLEKSVRYMISNLQYERHQAQAHGCNGGSYDEEIEEYKKLKSILQ